VTTWLPNAKKPVEWVGTSKEDLSAMPTEVKSTFGQALFDAQTGSKHPDAKPLRGFGGAGVLEIVEDFDGNAYRAVYTVKFEDAIYVLHAFQKKSKSGRATPKRDLNLIESRLYLAQEHYERTYRKKTTA
jgi:phage-related protein